MANQRYDQQGWQDREGQESWRQNRTRDDRYDSGRSSYETEGYGQPGLAGQGSYASASGFGDQERGGRSGYGGYGQGSYSGSRGSVGGSSGGQGGADADWDRRAGGGAYLSAQGGGWDQSGRGQAGGYGQSGGPGYGQSGGQGHGQGAGQGYGQTGSQGYPYSDRNRQHDRSFFQRAGEEVASWFEGDQGHRGKGPQGYSRSDQRIEDDVNDRLSDDPGVDASGIRVKVENGEVTLEGEIDSKQSKRMAEDCVDRVSGVKHVQNNLRVRQQGIGQSGDHGKSQMGGQSAVLAGTQSGQGNMGTTAGMAKKDTD